MGSPYPGRLHGLPGPVQRSAHQPVARPAQQGHRRRLQDSRLHDDHGNHPGRDFAVPLDTPDQLLWQAANHAMCHSAHHPGRCRLRGIPRFQRLARDESVMWVRLRGHDVSRHGVFE